MPCLALQVLGFGEYCAEANSVFQEAKAVAAKKKEGRARLENLGIPEEELLRQQQELFEKVNESVPIFTCFLFPFMIISACCIIYMTHMCNVMHEVLQYYASRIN